MPPSEVIVFDDASDDGTRDVVDALASASTVPIFFRQQAENRGVIGNFESAIQATTGDIVLLSDQDDVWYPQKISKVLETFGRDPAIGLVFSDADLVDANLKPLGRTLWQSIGFNEAERAQIRSPFAFDLLLRRFLCTGATLAFRRSLLDVVLPLSKHLIHDAWIALAVSAISKIECIDEPLIQYRQHDGQQIGERAKMRNWWTQINAARQMGAEYFERQLAFFRDLSTRVANHERDWVHSEVGRLAAEKVVHLEYRIAVRQHRLASIGTVVGQYLSGRYSRFSYGWKSAAQDLFL